MNVKTLFTAVFICLFCHPWIPLSAQRSQAGSAQSFTYVTKSPLDGTTDIPSYILDGVSSPHYYLKNEKVHVNFSTVTSGNNGKGSMRPGTPMDVMPVAERGYVDCLDWTEVILVPSSSLDTEEEAATLKRWDWNSRNAHISLPSISVINNEYLIAEGKWEGNDSIQASAVYTLFDNEPILRTQLTLKNSGTGEFKGGMGYIIDHDLGNQFCYLPGKGWGKSNGLAASKSGWTSNYVYEGTDVIADKSVPAHALAWDTTKITPYAVLYPGYISGVWFNVDIPAGGSQTITYYHIVSEPSQEKDTETFSPLTTLAEKVIGDTHNSSYIPIITGQVTDSDNGKSIAGVELICRDITANTVSTAVTDSSGYYHMRAPIGTYTITASRISFYQESRSIEIEKAEDSELDFQMAPITTTDAGYGFKISGSLAEGGKNDITLQNNKIALTLADQYVDTQLKTSKGKPVDFGLSNQTDAFDWINMPMVTLDRKTGENAWSNYCVTFDTVYVDEVSHELSRVIAKGHCDTIPLNVETSYEILPNETWITATSVFDNPTTQDITVWISDAMDLDEAGEMGFYPSELGNVVISDNNAGNIIYPSQPWMGQYGTDSNQTFGIVYSGTFAEGLELYGCKRWMVARKQVRIPANGSYTMIRKLVAVKTTKDENRDETFSNFYNQTLRGDMHLKAQLETSHKRPAAGDRIHIKYTLENTSSDKTYRNIRAQIFLPFNMNTENDELLLEEILPLQKKEMEWEVSVNEGGGNRIVRSTLFLDDEIINNTRTSLFTEGKGWYWGDNHTHSKHSDGSGTIAENLTAARNKGLSFVSCTDHNSVSQKQDILAFNQQNNDIIGILGNEVTISKVGHVVGMFINEVIPYSNINTDAKAQEVIDSIQRCNNYQGIAFIAHPYYPGLEWKYPSTTNMKGYEVWNGFYKPKHSVNKRAFALWDQRILQDGKAYLGIANSDGHNSGKISDPHIRVLCEEFTEEAYRKSIARGHFYGTDGPDVRFHIDSKMMGDTLLVSEQGSPVTLSVEAMNTMGIDSIRIIKNGSLLFAEQMNGENKVQKNYSSTAIPGDFFRVEVDGKDATFAFSNPIFVRQGLLSSTKEISQELPYHITYNLSSSMLHILMGSSQAAKIQVYTLSGQSVINRDFMPAKEHYIQLPATANIYIIGVNGVFTKLILP